MKQNTRITTLIVFGAIIGLSCSENGTPAPVPATAQESAAVAIVDALASGDMAAATKDFDATMRQSITTAQITEVWASVIAQDGPYTGQTAINSRQEQGYDVVRVICQFERGTKTVQVSFDSDLKVAGLFIQ